MVTELVFAGFHVTPHACSRVYLKSVGSWNVYKDTDYSDFISLMQSTGKAGEAKISFLNPQWIATNVTNYGGL